MIFMVEKVKLTNQRKEVVCFVLTICCLGNHTPLLSDALRMCHSVSHLILNVSGHTVWSQQCQSQCEREREENIYNLAQQHLFIHTHTPDQLLQWHKPFFKPFSHQSSSTMSFKSRDQGASLAQDDINFSQKRLQAAGRHGHGRLLLQYQPSVDDSKGCDLCGDTISDLGHYLVPR